MVFQNLAWSFDTLEGVTFLFIGSPFTKMPQSQISSLEKISCKHPSGNTSSSSSLATFYLCQQNARHVNNLSENY